VVVLATINSQYVLGNHCYDLSYTESYSLVFVNSPPKDLILKVDLINGMS